MLYTFSQASYDVNELERYIQHITEQDAILLWQDGVLLLLKFPLLLQQTSAPCFVLENDIKARHLAPLLTLNNKIKVIDLSQFIQLTEQYFPQFAL
ncbi:sulfurtransferase complex subunit TusB [Pasteurella oralis]|uniref:Sulfurtransferase complex subunit TusB n=1 Tax=Pasteurella oralis TaxID=1071947 RepID=A0ABW4NVA4_9PAST|nr:sulfurtransferase complex subunit TusB [Pasteurella oralis]